MGDPVLSGRYQILQSLGGGSFGQTYLAVDTQRPHSPRCVVKHLKPIRQDSGFMATARSLFFREAETLEKLGFHDQIPRLLAYFEEKSEFYLVQDFIPGQLLSQELSPQHLWSESQAIDFLRDILGILAFIHELGVIHRDLKPDNLIRRAQDGRLILIDFGAVKHMQTAFNAENISAQVVYGDTMTIGTPGYMAPEQAQGRPRPCSDLYSVGVIVIQAITGESPTQLAQGADGELEWSISDQIHPKLRDILRQMVHYHFQDRYQQASEVLIDLDRYTHPPKIWKQVKQFFLGTDIYARNNPASSPQSNLQTVSKPASSAPVFPVSRKNLGTTIPGNKSPDQVKSKRIKIVLSAFSLCEKNLFGQYLYAALQNKGYDVFIISQSVPMDATWLRKLNEALRTCDYYILLLCPQTARSEVLLQEVRTVKNIQSQKSEELPQIIPIRIGLPFEESLNYELRGYLQRRQQYLWTNPDDSEDVLTRVLNLIQPPNSGSELGIDSEQSSGSEPVPELEIISHTSTANPLRVLSTIPPAEEQPNTPPLPVADPELPEGQVQVASTFYTERPPIERRCEDVIVQPGALIRIKAPRQMGKTSLMARTLHHAQQNNCATVALSLQLADSSTFQSLDRLLQWLCATISRRLRLPNTVKQNWDDIFGSKYNCTSYFEEHILPELDRPLVLGFDEVDRVFEQPDIASDFFGLLRAWHEEAKNQNLWKKLRLIVVHATEVYIPLNANQSPFNVGLPIELPDFNAEQLTYLAHLHQLDWSDRQVEQLQALIGGHPYLARLSMYHIAQGDLSFTELLQTAHYDNSLFRDHLRGYWWKLQKNESLAQAFDRVLQSSTPISLEPELLFKLHSLGLIRLDASHAMPRCDLYRQYFSGRYSRLKAS